MKSSGGSLFALFAGSGFAALVYQVVWQRSLFAIYGIHVEAVTVVVTAFMLGLCNLWALREVRHRLQLEPTIYAVFSRR